MQLTDKELLLIDLVQPHWDTFSREIRKLVSSQNFSAPQIFISYAWPNSQSQSFDDEKEIQPWLLNLYEKLTCLGIQVLFDIKTMTPGTHIDAFMQQGIETSHKILVIGTPSYQERSKQDTNVAKEVKHIQNKIIKDGTHCVIPLLYCGNFGNAFPSFGVNNPQILGVDVHNSFIFYEKIPELLESLLPLLQHGSYQPLKQAYHLALDDIKAHGLTDVNVATFIQDKAQKARLALQMQRESVMLAMERTCRHHPDYQVRPANMQPLSLQLRNSLQQRYQQHGKINGIFGKEMDLEEQYINLQMLFQVEEKKSDGEDGKNKEFHDKRMTSYEDIFSKKQALDISELFIPAKQLLKDNQKTTEKNPDKPPRFLLIQGRAGIGKTTFTYYISQQWSTGKLYSEYDWVFTLRFRDLRQPQFGRAYEQGQVWLISDWVYETHFAGKFDKQQFKNLWDWIIAPQIATKVLFILDGYDEAPTTHPCQQAVSELLNSRAMVILTSRPYGLSDLPLDRRELEVVGFVDDNVEKYIQLYFGPQSEEKSKQIITAFKANPALWGNAHIPITLNVLCGVLEQTQRVDEILKQLETISGLYQEMELALFTQAYRKSSTDAVKHQQQLKALDRVSKKELLVENAYKHSRYYLSLLAFEGFRDEQLIIPTSTLNRVLRDAGVAITQISDVVDELLNLGMLRPVLGEKQTTQDPVGYEFLHLTFQEYYAGLAIANKFIKARDENDVILNEIHAIKFNPRYQIVFWFAAGLLNENHEAFDRLMKLVDGKKCDDLIGNVKLGLQLRCAHEAWDASSKTKWLDKITKIIQEKIKLIFEQNVNKLERWSTINFTHSWIQLLRISARWQRRNNEFDLFVKIDFISEASIKFILKIELMSPKAENVIIEDLLKTNGSYTYSSSYLTAFHCLSIPGKHEFLLKIENLLDNTNSLAQERALELIEVLGIDAATPGIVLKLKHLLDNTHKRFGEVGSQKTLSYDDKKAHENLIKAIASCGDAAANNSVIEFFLKSLYDFQWRHLTIQIIENFGLPLQLIKVLSSASLLLDTYYPSRYHRLKKNKIAAPTIFHGILSVFFDVIKDSEQKKPTGNYAFLNKLKDEKTTEKLFHYLVSLLQDDNKYFRGYAAFIMSNLEPNIVSKIILPILINLLNDEDKSMQILALDSIGRLGAMAIKPEILQNLANLSRHKSWKVRASVAITIGQMNTVTPEALQILLSLLQYGSWYVQREVADAICILGPNAAMPEIIDSLSRLLSKKNVQIEQDLNEFNGSAPIFLDEEDDDESDNDLNENNDTNDSLQMINLVEKDDNVSDGGYQEYTIANLHGVSFEPKDERYYASGELDSFSGSGYDRDGNDYLDDHVISAINAFGVSGLKHEICSAIFSKFPALSLLQEWYPGAIQPEFAALLLAEYSDHEGASGKRVQKIEKKIVSIIIEKFSSVSEISEKIIQLLNHQDLQEKSKVVVLIGRLESRSITSEIVLALKSLLDNIENFISDTEDYRSEESRDEIITEILRVLIKLNYTKGGSIILVDLFINNKLTRDKLREGEIKLILRQLIKHELSDDKISYRQEKLISIDSLVALIEELGPEVVMTEPSIIDGLISVVVYSHDYNNNDASVISDLIFRWRDFFIVSEKLIKLGEFVLLRRNVILFGLIENLVDDFLKKNTALSSEYQKSLYFVLLMNGYFSGNHSMTLVWQAEKSSYTLQGFNDKTAFSLQLTLKQASWFAQMTPKVIEALDQQKWDSLSQLLAAPIAELPSITGAESVTSVTQAMMTSSYQSPTVNNVANPSSDAITMEGIRFSELKVSLNLAKVSADKRASVLTVMEQYAENCRPENVVRNYKKEIIALTFEDQDMVSDLTATFTRMFKSLPGLTKN